MRWWRKRSPERTKRGERGGWPNKGLLRLQKGRNNRTTRRNGKSNNKVDIVGGPKLPVDVACCRIVRERISPPPLSFPRCSENLSRGRTSFCNVGGTPPLSSSLPPPPPPPPLPPPPLSTLLPSLPSSPLVRALLHSDPLRSSQEEHGSQAGDPSTPSFSSNPRGSYSPASFPARHFPSPFAPFFPPASSSLPAARCILNQSLGGNAITRHHDASTIFYFKLLYVLVPPPCTPSLATLLVGSVHPPPLVSALRQ